MQVTSYKLSLILAFVCFLSLIAVPWVRVVFYGRPPTLGDAAIWVVMGIGAAFHAVGAGRDDLA